MIVIDRYTKSVLTVIAAALVLLVLLQVKGQLVPVAHAAGPQEIRIVGADPEIVVRTHIDNAAEIGKQVAAWMRKRQIETR